jgi:hypothetical protein
MSISTVVVIATYKTKHSAVRRAALHASQEDGSYWNGSEEVSIPSLNYRAVRGDNRSEWLVVRDLYERDSKFNSATRDVEE